LYFNTEPRLNWKW